MEDAEADVVLALAGLRESQLRGEDARLEEKEKALQQEIAGYRAEFLTLASLRGVESIDPAPTRAGTALTPHVVESDRALAERYRKAARAASWGGIGLATGLGALTLAAPAAVTLTIGGVFMYFVTGAGAGVMLSITNTNLRDASTAARINKLTSIFGVVLGGGLAAVLAMRFVPNIATLELIGVPLTFVEIALLALAGLFAAADTYYSWSLVLTAQYNQAVAQLTDVRKSRARVGVDLMELQYQREVDDTTRMKRAVDDASRISHGAEPAPAGKSS